MASHKHFKGERELQSGKREFLNPLKKGLDPSATSFILQTPSQNLGLRVLSVEAAILSPR